MNLKNNHTNSLLPFYAKLNKSFIHGHGRKATLKLIQLLDCKNGEKILEIGCGTGSTLVELSGRYKNTTFYGVDCSEEMLECANKRIQFCKVTSNLKLQVIEANLPFPFESNSFDKIYIESVLGIQEGEQLNKMLKNIFKLLKTDGILIFNETIWRNEITFREAKEYNEKCKELFGIIQVNSNYLHLSNWVQLMDSIGFEIIEKIDLDILPTVKIRKKRKIYSLKSTIFSIKGVFKSRFITAYRKQNNSYIDKMNTIAPKNKLLLKAYLIKAIAKK